MNDTILSERSGWTITKDVVGRRGGRVVEAIRVGPSGVTTCVAELRERIRREYDASRDFWSCVPTGEWCEPHLRPCFAPGVVA